MRAALPLALVICACGSKPKASAPVGNTTELAHPPGPLGLAEGVTWTFEGTLTTDDGTTPVSLTTEVVSVENDGKKTIYRVTGWPHYGARSDAETTISVEDGVMSIEHDPWIRIAPELASYECPDSEYCWSVEPTEDGVDVYYRTRPDVTVYHLDADRGVTGFEYHHNGSTEDLELQRRD